MATALYLEQYLDSLETLPGDLQKNFSQMRTLDHKSQKTLLDILEASASFTETAKQLPKKFRKEKFKEVDGLYCSSIEIADEKVKLANQAYELVDEHIRRLDADLARFETEVKEKTMGYAETQQANAVSTETKKRKSQVDGEESEETTKKKSKKKSEKSGTIPDVTSPGGNAMLPLAALGAPSDVLDMPVDPNEPTYCICHQVSYGEMIGCDNQDCPIEWFHFPCVGLNNKPKGKWFCPHCVEDRKKLRL